ncbi:transglycosylase associated protein [Balneicella halophila]|uniref:Transglycosylase associated protein n=1 Tax=Balneicella halophila TaxID=1537566 RepID=A0A7L4URJ2_BALHA|nr:GlsB/YeaQ/YmgE family stress response membrane protein [Balneicella halophila]PVX51847.1 transglycosylase associated protein [Balneicella halophila]
MELIGAIIIGAIAGWLGSLIFKGSGLGLLWNIIIGILGGAVGSWLFGVLGVSLGSGWVPAIITGAIGAIVILAIINLLFGVKKR